MGEAWKNSAIPYNQGFLHLQPDPEAVRLSIFKVAKFSIQGNQFSGF
ncbi:MAG: hypothetical protein V8S58_11460 [Lachnospiraceae bacterium]